MQITLTSIDHITLQVADIHNSVRWYSTSFNCQICEQGKNYAILQFENIKLMLVLPSHEPAHIAFVREDANTLGALSERLDGSYSTFLSDPTGNPIEIIGAKQET